MNGNIEVINEHCFGVNMQYMKSGYIKELKLYPGAEIEPMILGDYGAIILDKDSKLYPTLKRIFPIVMQKTTEELQSTIDSVKNPEILDALEDLYVNVAGWEIKRRCVLAEYMESQPKPTFKDKITKFFRRKVKLCQRFKQE